MALHDHMDLVVSLPSGVSKLLAVSKHTEEVETTRVPVETPSVNPPSQGFTTLTEIKSVSLELGTANQVEQATSSSALQTISTTPLTRGFVFAPPPLLNSGLVGMGPRFPTLTGAPGGIVPPFFPTFPINPPT